MRRLTMVLVVLALVSAACSSKKDNPSTGATATTSGSTLAFFDGPPPWPLADRQAERIAKAGLPALTAEGTIVHFHAHLDVFYNGQHVTIPAGVGIDLVVRVISPLHTHFDTGVVHVEAEADEPVTLGQFLTEWGLRLDNDCVAVMCDAKQIKVFVNGTQVAAGAADVAGLVITADKEIALVLGTPPDTIPKGYKCVNPTDACPKTPSP